MSETSQLQYCAKCGAVLSGYAADRLCAACLLESAILEPETPIDVRTPVTPLLSFNDYELLEEIARGGMGVVYRARQISLNRTVAIKMILGGHLANAAELKRFRVEAETAAQLQHPNIVAIHEVGDHVGQPFFSMALVEGRNLAQLVRDEPLPSRKAASYLKTIAEAIQYAHSRGVLHRDLKPSNVLIDENDQPRITDFGLAKRIVAQASAPASMSGVPAARSDTDSGRGRPENPQAETPALHELTQTGQVLGSPSFIPPEQAAGQKQAISPASDVYSLGAILYHCLTARPPFVAETLTQTLRMVAEQEPVSPRLLNASVPRDLETICLKCLEKDPARRYVTAQELADDLGRYLDNEPIHARPVGVVGRVHRWCLRNKALAATGTAILALLLVVAIGSPIAAFRIDRERRQARAQEQKARVITEFLSDTLEGAGPLVAQGRDPSLLRDILDKAATRVGTELTNQPEARADVSLIIGKTYIDLGAYSNALALTQEALRLRREHFGPKHITVAEALNNLGAIYAELGDTTTAETYDREALDLKKELLGRDDLNVALSMSNLGFRFWNRGDYAGAEVLHREALRIRRLRLPAGHPDIGVSFNNLAMALWSRGEFDAAELMFRDALAAFQQAFGADHRHVATMLNNLSEVLHQLGRLAEAEPMNRDALAMRQKHLGKAHADTAYTQHNLAGILRSQGRLDEAAPLHREALAVIQTAVGTNHQYVAESLTSFALTLAKQGELAAAETTQKEALATAGRVLGQENPVSAVALDRLAILLATRGRLDEAESMLTNGLAMSRKVSGKEHPDVIPLLWHLSWVQKQRGELGPTELLRREAMTLSSKGGNYAVRAFTDGIYDVADLLQAQKRFAEAETLLHEVSAYLEGRPANPPFQRALCERLVRFYESWDRATPDAGKSAEAAAWRKKLEETRASGR